MNCKQARDLFSGRLDGELRASDAGRLHRHLAECAGCAARWASFESTVRMLRTLPSVSPDPSFVGQVLDRVRGYEAGLQNASAAKEPRWALPRLSDLRDRLAWPRILFPARLAGAMALGLLAGFLVVGHDWLGGSSPRVARAPSVSVASDALRGGASGASGGSALIEPNRPFADLVRKLADSPSTGSAADSMARGTVREIDPQYAPGDPQGVGRPVQLDPPDGRPQIIF